MINKIVLGDAVEVLPRIEDGTVDLVLTDPPYFLDKLDDNWDSSIDSITPVYAHTAVKFLPAGMVFDERQGLRLYKWYSVISKELYRVLKPGGFFFSFSIPRLYHRLVSAIDDAGFQIRDCFIWIHTRNRPKAMSLDHFIDWMECDKATKRELKEKLKGWKTPQVKSCFEPIVMAQKPCEKTYLDNVIKYGVGLVNTEVEIGAGLFPANVLTTARTNPVMDRCFLVGQPSKEEKGKFNTHRTVKPLAICEYLIKLTTFSEEAIVLDPFVGSGTTAVAAKKLGRKFIGVEINSEYVEIARKRLECFQLRL